MNTSEWLQAIAEMTATLAIVIAFLRGFGTLILGEVILQIIEKRGGDCVVEILENRKADLKRINDDMYESRINEINTVITLANANVYAIDGIRATLQDHGTKLQLIGTLAPLLDRQTNILDRLTINMENIQREMAGQNIEIAKIQTAVQIWRDGDDDRRQHPR